jgi:hypothetical protein
MPLISVRSFSVPRIPLGVVPVAEQFFFPGGAVSDIFL